METQDRGIGKRDDGDGSFPSGKKIVVKLKNWKPAPEINRVEEIKTHYCKQCYKVFSSGKALGGHMSSAHVQAAKDYSGQMAKSRLSKGSGCYSSSGDHVCSVCGKNFPSQKSLYGHMRCHPEREWRGMYPPSIGAGKRSDSSEEYDEDDDVMEDAETETADSVDSLQRWGGKARRGRSGRPHIFPPRVAKSLQDSSSDEEDEEEEDGLLSRQQLVKLLKRHSDSNEDDDQGDSYSCSLKNHMSESPESSCLRSHPKNKKRKWYHGCCPYHAEKTHMIKRQRFSVDGKEESDTESDLIVEGICFLANAKHITPAVEPRLIQEKHICNICNKVFPSHQALGGHKSSHNKLKLSILNTADMGKNDTGNNMAAQDAKAKGEDNSYVCQICGKWFPTARALGGHRKIHSNKGGRSNGIGIGGDGERVRGLMDFDLNMALDENGVAGGGDEPHVLDLFK